MTGAEQALDVFDGRLEYARTRVDRPAEEWRGQRELHGWQYECPGGCGGEFWVPDDPADMEQVKQVVVDHLRTTHPAILRQLDA